MEIPLWVVASLGRQVELVSGFEGSCEVYPAMHRGVLMGIQFDADLGRPCALVALDMDDLGYLEGFGFGDIRSVGSASYSLDAGRGMLVS